MKKLLLILFSVLLVACSGNKSGNDELLSKFNSTWNIYEDIVNNDDGSVTYYALPWGGLVASFKEHNMPVDWSGYESITFEFAEPTKVATQIMVSSELKTTGKAGITSLTCYFDGHDVRSVGEVALQASDSTTLQVKKVYLTKVSSTWQPTMVWTGECAFGNWENGFVVDAEKFKDAQPGDKLEFVCSTDHNNPDVTYWLLKTIYDTTDSTLEGNSSELNEWGCVLMGRESKSYRMALTDKDIKNLQVKGLFTNGYYMVVTKVNLLRKIVKSDSADKR